MVEAGDAGGGAALRWSIKRSFGDYVRSLGDGEITLEGVSESDGIFAFPARRPREADPSVLTFAGRIRFTGYAGMLELDISDPEIDLHARPKPVITVWSATDRERVVFATFDPATRETGDAGTIIRAPSLTFEAAFLFGGAYAAGTRLDDLLVCAERTRG